MSALEIPNTDSPEVMRQAVSLWLTNVIWDQQSRGVPPERTEEEMVGLYLRVYQALHEAQAAKR